MPWRRKKSIKQRPGVLAARREREHSDRLRQQAAKLAREIDDMRQRDHLTEAITNLWARET